MNLSRLLGLLAMLALLLAPAGRMAAAGAAAGPRHAPAVMAGHCDEAPAPADQRSGGEAVDCAIACAMTAPASAPPLDPRPVATEAEAAVVPDFLPGLLAEADPPPPRLS